MQLQTIKGKQTIALAAAELAAWAAAYPTTTLDLGTGDGRFVQHLARRHPDRGVIGVDLNAANLRHASRRAGANALFVLADALTLPAALGQTATDVTINFPWGSLLRGLLDGDHALLSGVRRVARAGATLNLRLNAAALAEAGWALEDGAARLSAVLREHGFPTGPARRLGPAELRAWPTTWAKRLAFGRDPRAIFIEARLSPDLTTVPASPPSFGDRRVDHAGGLTVTTLGPTL